jgi:hypothetical protein
LVEHDPRFRWDRPFSDLPSPAEASSQVRQPCQGFAQAGNRCPLFGIMLWRRDFLRDPEGTAMVHSISIIAAGLLARPHPQILRST